MVKALSLQLGKSVQDQQVTFITVSFILPNTLLLRPAICLDVMMRSLQPMKVGTGSFSWQKSEAALGMSDQAFVSMCELLSSSHSRPQTRRPIKVSYFILRPSLCSRLTLKTSYFEHCFKEVCFCFSITYRKVSAHCLCFVREWDLTPNRIEL